MDFTHPIGWHDSLIFLPASPSPVAYTPAAVSGDGTQSITIRERRSIFSPLLPSFSSLTPFLLQLPNLYVHPPSLNAHLFLFLILKRQWRLWTIPFVVSLRKQDETKLKSTTQHRHLQLLRNFKELLLFFRLGGSKFKIYEFMIKIKV